MSRGRAQRTQHGSRISLDQPAAAVAEEHADTAAPGALGRVEQIEEVPAGVAQV